MKQIIKKTILPNGITILTDYMPHAYSVAVGAWIARGSRHESKEEFGLSHFYEHLVFKGTEKRSALEIARAIATILSPSKIETRKSVFFIASAVCSSVGGSPQTDSQR